MAVVDDCLLVDNSLDVPVQLRPAVIKIIHRGHSCQEAVLARSNLWWLHMHEDMVNLAAQRHS